VARREQRDGELRKLRKLSNIGAVALTIVYPFKSRNLNAFSPSAPSAPPSLF
jgi:hypothetical protein